MTTKYYAILTTLGAGKLANAAALGTKLQITHMALGDGGGVLPSPNASQTALIAEKRRAPLNSLSVDAANSSQIIAEQVIPEDEGGWWIREIGLFDADGVLIAVANCAETYKPLLQEGSGRTQTVRMILIVNSTDAVTLKIDPSVVLATRKFVDDSAAAIKVYVDAQKASPAFTGKPTAPTAAKTDNSTQVATTAFVKSVTADYATTASPALSGTPTTPTPAAGNNSQQLANTAFVQTAIAALLAGSPAALDTLKELADALGGDAHFSTTVLNALAGKMEITKNGADINDVAQFRKNLGLGDVIREDDANAQFKLKHWSSAGSTLTTNTPLIINHGLTINPDLCSLNIKLRCVAANNGYSTGDYCVGFYPRITGGDTSAAAGAIGALLTATTCQFNVGNAGIALMPKGSGVAVGINTTATFAQWAFEFHIIYQ
ncbi:phage tail protein [Erwinia rhapontici]|uniref:phage tail protein n=1 Tax=Erwinia rhapontici TaxID=55212 RepID=UPI00105BC366|nr:phage tail protein [Erwinia rhapontici]TDS93408.1 tail-collar fiber protein [Erwinia rhapontici]